MEVIYINKQKADIYNKPITRKIQIADIGDIANRKSSYSYTIKLPRTANNIKILKQLSTHGNQSRTPYEETIIDYVVDGVYLVSNGTGIIKATSGDFELNIIDGIKSLNNVLSSAKLAALDLSDLEHVLTAQNVVDSFGNTEGYIYTIANYGLGLDDVLQAEKIAPSTYVHTIFRRIFESNGLVLQGDFFTANTDYLSDIITPTDGYEITDDAFTSVSNGQCGSDNISVDRTQDYTFFTSNKYTLSDVSLSGHTISGGNIIIGSDGYYKFDLEITKAYTEGHARIDVYKNGEKYVSSYIDKGTGTETKSISINAISGDELEFRLRVDAQINQLTFDPYTFNFSVDCELSFDITVYKQTGGNIIDASKMMPDITQINFLKQIISRYGLILRPVRDTNIYEFKPIEEILQDRGNAEDWTVKLSGINSENYVPNYSKNNRAKYNYYEGAAFDDYDGNMQIENYNISDEGTLFDVVFEIPDRYKEYTLSSQWFNEVMYLIELWESDGEEVKNKSTLPKIGRITNISKSITVRLYTGTSVNYSGNVPFFGIEGQGMQYFINNYYKSFKSITENYKEVSVNLLLNTIDVYNLDFFRLKYLKQTGRYYYLNNVQHTSGKLAKVNMLEILEFPQNQPPIALTSVSIAIERLTNESITYGVLFADYEDEEQDQPLKIKIIDGFNSNIILKQNGVAITEETEINAGSLNLTIEEVRGLIQSGYSESWQYAVADEGSGNYGQVRAYITATVEASTNQPPVAVAGNDYIFTADPPEEVNITLDGSGSTDDENEITGYLWEIISQPAGSTGNIAAQDYGTPTASFYCDADSANYGNWTFRLTVEDRWGEQDTDDITITIQE